MFLEKLNIQNNAPINRSLAILSLTSSAYWVVHAAVLF